MRLEIFNAEISEPEMLKAAIDACTRWTSAERAVIYVEARVPMDAPEHKPGAEIEVHS